MTLSGINFKPLKPTIMKVLIPLLVDDPLWVDGVVTANSSKEVLIPLLVDDPLWDSYYYSRMTFNN